MSAVTAYGIHDEDRAALAEVADALLRQRPDDPTAGVGEGWFGIGIPEEAGGVGGSLSDLAVIVEAAGAAHAATSVPWVTGVVGTLLTRHGVPAVLGPLAAGAVPVGVPIALAPCTATGGRLAGELTVIGAADAGGYVAMPFVDVADEGLALVPATAVAITALPSLDASRTLSRVTLVDVDVHAATIVHAPGLFAEWQALTCTVAALDAAGAARAALDCTVAYCVARHQFGRAIGSFQAYKHRVAHAFVELKLAQSLAFRAAAQLTDDPAQAFSAGLYATTAAVHVCGEAIQLHGGIGFTWESGLPGLLRRARLDQIIGHAGATTARRLLVAAGLTG